MSFSKRQPLIVAFILFAFNVAFGEPWPVPFHQDALPEIKPKSAVVLGAGPAALIAGHVLLQKGFEQVFFFEWRELFSRFNPVNFYPENWVMLKHLGIDADFTAVGKSRDLMTLFVERDGITMVDLQFRVAPIISEFDFRRSVHELYDKAGAGLLILNLADLQHQLAQGPAARENVFFISQKAHLSLLPDAKHYAVDFEHQGKKNAIAPSIVIVAEGAHSETRSALGILMEQRLPTQYLCSGAVSLEGVFTDVPSLIEVLDQSSHAGNVCTFGIFGHRPYELFVNGQASSSDDDVDECLLQNARSLITHHTNGHVDTSKLTVIKKSQGIITIEPSIANQKSVGNAILFGDAAGHSTPKGGVGFTLITGPYPQALMDLLDAWDTEDRGQALEIYSRRVHEIVEFWHYKTAL